MSYETGFFIAIVLKIYELLMFTFMVNSQYQRNLNKIGLRLSWLTFEPKEMEAKDYQNKSSKVFYKSIIYIAYNFCHIFFSWLYIGYYLINLLWHFSKDRGVPQNIKELRWKLRNQNLTKDEVIIEFSKIKNLNQEQIEVLKLKVEEQLMENPGYKSSDNKASSF